MFWLSAFQICSMFHTATIFLVWCLISFCKEKLLYVRLCVFPLLVADYHSALEKLLLFAFVFSPIQLPLFMIHTVAFLCRYLKQRRNMGQSSNLYATSCPSSAGGVSVRSINRSKRSSAARAEDDAIEADRHRGCGR